MADTEEQPVKLPEGAIVLTIVLAPDGLYCGQTPLKSFHAELGEDGGVSHTLVMKSPGNAEALKYDGKDAEPAKEKKSGSGRPRVRKG